MIEEFTQEQKDAIVMMIGTKGLDSIVAMANLMPPDHRLRNPYLLACHLILNNIERVESIIREGLQSGFSAEGLDS